MKPCSIPAKRCWIHCPKKNKKWNYEAKKIKNIYIIFKNIVSKSAVIK
jgi:agmatine/peptidylarginine deiminase